MEGCKLYNFSLLIISKQKKIGIKRRQKKRVHDIKVKKEKGIERGEIPGIRTEIGKVSAIRRRTEVRSPIGSMKKEIQS
jgi:hypothetical protein